MELNGAAQGQQGTLDSGECMWVGQDQRICSSCQLQDGLLNIFNWWPATKSAGLRGLQAKGRVALDLFFSAQGPATQWPCQIIQGPGPRVCAVGSVCLAHLSRC